ncbi:Amuc_1102 family pilus-like protein [Prosthecobacter sp. SYSU 5D2]|uniref:Amuc_1102 family pilus-like protein n=1 Tax=Prosthecobacter sp. SYSU 5D2 TaxID=3134134 RepID=UPI0031FED115
MMKIYTALSILVIGLHSGIAQDAESVQVKGEKLQINSIQTPQFQASNVGEKRWRPKDWLEVDLPFEIKLANAAGGRNGSLSVMTVNYYIGLNAQNKEGKFEVIKGVFNYIDIPASEKCHALAYVAPASLRRLLGKDGFTTSDIKAWGYEIMVDGKRIAGDSSIGNAWWEKGDSFSMNDGVLLAKTDTPFGILWGDYDVSAKKN